MTQQSKEEQVRIWTLRQVGGPYLMGGTGEACTVSYRRARAAQYPLYADKILANCPRLKGSATSCQGCRWWDESIHNGKPAYDCAQLTRRAMAQAGITLVSGATSQWKKTKWAAKGTLDSLPAGRLALLYRQDTAAKWGHTGVYLGDGTIVHAKGHAYGVVREPLGVPRFTHWGVPEGLYEAEAIKEMEGETVSLKRGDKDEKGAQQGPVRTLQQLLLGAGMLLPKYGADGAFGAETQAAVISFQGKAGLPETGVADQATLEALQAAAEAAALAAAGKAQAEAQAEGEAPQEAREGAQEALAPSLSPEALAAIQEARAHLNAALEGLGALLNRRG